MMQPRRWLTLLLLSLLLFGSGAQAQDTITDLSGIDNGVIGVMTGATGETIARTEFPGADIRCFDNIMDAALALKAGQIDYVLTAFTTALNLARNNPDLLLLPDELARDSAAIATRKEDPALGAKINLVLRQFKEDGTLDEIISHWIKPSGEAYEYTPVTPPAQGDTLVVAIAANREPMVFVQDNAFVGLDCELIERIAAEMGMRVQYLDMAFSALIPALTSGTADCVISNITATEERKKSVDFTEGYFTNPQVVLIRNPGGYAAKPWYIAVRDSFVSTFLVENRWVLLVQGLGTTAVISICSALLGTLLGFGVCLMRRSRRAWLSSLAKFYIDIVRGIPVLVLLLLIYYVILAPLHLNPVLVSVLTFSINFSAYTSELMRTSIESVDKGQIEAATATGFGRVQTFLLFIFPQAARIALPVYRGELISMVKMTSVVGYVAIMDLTKASDLIRSRTFEAAFPLVVIALLYLAISHILVMFLSKVEISIEPTRRKRVVKL